MSKPDNPIDDVKDLAAYVRGMADAMQNTRLSDAAAWLERLSNRVCAGNVIGCRGGRDKEANRLAREWAAKYSVEIQGVGVTAYCDLVSGIVTALRNEWERAITAAQNAIISHAPMCGNAMYCDCGAQQVRNEIIAAIRNPKGE